MKRNLQLMILSVLLILGLGVHAKKDGEFFITESIEAVVENVSMRNRTVSFNGKTYKYNIDVEKSEFSSEEEKAFLVKLRSIKKNEKYYFTLYYSGRNDKDAIIVFVSKQQPLG